MLHGSGVSSMAFPRFIQTDEGGELWASYSFQNLAKRMGFIMQPIASDASFQNGIAEQPNRTLGDMMRSLLLSANLGPEYWSWSLLHAIYLKNRLPHRATGTMPFQAFTGKRPNIKKIRIFGCPIFARLPGKRPAKLDYHVTTGIFLGFTSTMKNIYYQDNATKRVKIATHVTFDEVGYTLPQETLSTTQRSLQQHAILSTKVEDDYTAPLTPNTPDQVLYVKRISDVATLPPLATPDSAGLDLYSAIDVSLAPRK